MTKTEIDYSNTIIYKLCCKDFNVKDIYVGHTTNFIQRKNQHKTSCCNEHSKNYNRYVYQFIRENGCWDNWDMIQIEVVNCENKRNAELIEHNYIKTLEANLNSNNPHAMCKENPQQYKKDWYKENKEEILEKGKTNYYENKDEKLAYQKEYAELNKEQIAERQKEYRVKNKEKLSEQKKQYREAHKEQINASIKAWHEKNKDVLKEKRSQIVNCECGCQFIIANKNRHLQSKTHIAYQNKLEGIIEEPKPTISEEERQEKLKQQQKEYREKNAEQIKEKKREYNNSHKEEMLEKYKEYYQHHKEEIKQKTKQYVEENKEKVKEYKKQNYLLNKEKILERMKQMITCECGATIRFAGKAEHLRSMKHKSYMDLLCGQQNISSI